MKTLFQKLIAKFVKKAINKSVNDAVANPDVTPEVPKVESVTILGDNSKKNFWKFVVQTAISILTAILTALGATSCMGLH